MLKPTVPASFDGPLRRVELEDQLAEALDLRLPFLDGRRLPRGRLLAPARVPRRTAAPSLLPLLSMISATVPTSSNFKG